MPAHDTTRARAVMEAHMTDEVRIERDPEGTRDDTYDPDTLERVAPDGDLDEVYAGVALITPQRSGRRIVDIGGVPHHVALYAVSILASAAPEVDDLVTVTASDDDELTDRQLTVVEVDYRTVRARRRLLCELVRPAPRA